MCLKHHESEAFERLAVARREAALQQRSNLKSQCSILDLVQVQLCSDKCGVMGLGRRVPQITGSGRALTLLAEICKAPRVEGFKMIFFFSPVVFMTLGGC